MNPSTVSRPATGRDLEAITDAMTSAFTGDPVWGGWAFPDKKQAYAQRRVFFGFLLDKALRHGWVRVTPGLEAVACWIPPGELELLPEEEARLNHILEGLLGERARPLLEAQQLFETSHPRDRPHFHLTLLGTHDKHRGRGLGMGLLRDCLRLIDAQGMPAYLESTNPVNLKAYERLGFAKVGAFTLPAGGPTVDTMWREPSR